MVGASVDRPRGWRALGRGAVVSGVVLGAAFVLSWLGRDGGAIWSSPLVPPATTTPKQVDPAARAPAVPLLSDEEAAEAGARSDPPAPRIPVAAADSAGGSGAVATPAHVGLVRFAVRDSTGASPDAVTIRFGSVDRWGEYHGAAAATTRLTAGVYDLIVSLGGHEPLSRAGVEVRPQHVTDLGVLQLVRGAGAIGGTIAGPAVAADESVRVALFGRGRARCGLCPTSAVERDGHAACCGYSERSTSRSVDADRRFLFRGLAAGVYHLVVRIGTARHPVVRTVELARGDTEMVTITREAEHSVSLRLLRADGAPYFARADRGIRSVSAEDLVEESEGHEDSFLVFRALEDEALLGSATAQVYLDRGAWMTEVSVSEAWAVVADLEAPIDRARGPRDELRFSSPRPRPAVSIDAVGRDANHWTLAPLPARQLRIEVAFRGDAGAAVVDLRHGNRDGVGVVLRPRRRAGS